MTVTELLDTLQTIEEEGNGDACLYAYLGRDGLKVQAEGTYPKPALVGVILTASIEVNFGAEVVAP